MLDTLFAHANENTANHALRGPHRALVAIKPAVGSANRSFSDFAHFLFGSVTGTIQHTKNEHMKTKLTSSPSSGAVSLPLFAAKSQPQAPDSATTSSQKAASTVAILITPDGKFKIADESYDIAGLTAKLKELAATKQKPNVVIRASKDIPYKRVVEVLDAAKTAGLTHIALAEPITAK